MTIRTRAALLMLAAAGMAVASRADNTQSAWSEFLPIGLAAEDQVGPGKEAWFEFVLAQGNSYEVRAWAPWSDPTETGNADVCTAVDLFLGTGGTAQGVDDTDREPLLLSLNHVGDSDTIVPTTSGTFRARLTDCTSPQALHLAQVIVVETTLVSPWWYAASPYTAVAEIRNNASAPVPWVLTLFGANGTPVAATTGTLAANGSQAVLLNSLPNVVATGQGSARLAYHGPLGSLAANLTSLSLATGISFDSPFVARMPGGGFPR